MTNLTWNHACTVGVSAMDDQHGILMDTMNDLHLASVHGAGPEKVSELLNRLIEFTRMHFLSEEQLMEHYAIPGREEHRAEHRQLLANLLQSLNSLQRGERVSMRALLGLLRSGFLDHIGSLDRQCGAWLNERGVS